MCLLPSVFLLALLAVRRDVVWPLLLALVAIGLSYLVVWSEVADRRPEDGWEEADKVAARRQLAHALAYPLLVAVFSLCLVIGWRLLLGSPQEPGPGRPVAPPAPPGREWPGVRLWWLIVLVAGLALMVSLAR